MGGQVIVKGREYPLAGDNKDRSGSIGKNLTKFPLAIKKNYKSVKKFEPDSKICK